MSYKTEVITEERTYYTHRSNRKLAEQWANRQSEQYSEFEKVIARRITTPSGKVTEY